MKTDVNEKFLRLFGITVLASAIIAWLSFGEDGFIGQFGTIGFAFCHQIPARTPQFSFGACPLCFRCTGLFFGTLVSALTLIRTQFTFRDLSRSGVITFCLSSFGMYVFDGVKTTGFFRGIATLYPDLALIRYTTGYAMGITVGAFVSVIWREAIDLTSPDIYANFNWRTRWIIPVFGMIGALLLSTNAPFAIPFQFIFSLLVGTAPFILTGTLFSVVISAIDLLIHPGKPKLQLSTRLILGFALAAIFIGGMVILRYQLSNGWVRTFQVNNTVN